MRTTEVRVTDGPARLDRFLAEQELGLSRARLQRLIRDGLVLLNGQTTKAASRVAPGDRVTVSVPPPQPLDLAPHPIPLPVVYQDAELLVVNKPAGLTAHPAPGHPTDTVVNSLLGMGLDLPGIGGTMRPGIVHRLDKDTSGLMMIAKTDRAHHDLSAQLKNRQVRKGYTALALGELPDDEGVIDAPIARDPRHRKRMAVVTGGREAVTRYRVIERLPGGALAEVYPATGRTHQIRVHFAALGHPLLGDAIYGGKSPLLGHHFLHAHHLAFRHPVTGATLEFRAPLPSALQDVLDKLRRCPQENPAKGPTT